METILFFIKRKKLLKDGSASIFVRVTSGKLSAEVATGKSFCPPNGWQLKAEQKGTPLKQSKSMLFLTKWNIPSMI